jgi:hypothetical protein
VSAQAKFCPYPHVEPALAIYRRAMENFTRATVIGPNVPLPLASRLRAGGSANYRYCSIGSSPTVT